MEGLALRSLCLVGRPLAFSSAKMLLRPSQQFLASADWELLVVCEQSGDVILVCIKVGDWHLQNCRSLYQQREVRDVPSGAVVIDPRARN